MSHIIIITNPPPGGGNLVAQESTANIEIKWAPSHELTPAQERHRVEKAQTMLENIVDMLQAPM